MEEAFPRGGKPQQRHHQQHGDGEAVAAANKEKRRRVRARKRSLEAAGGGGDVDVTKTTASATTTTRSSTTAIQNGDDFLFGSTPKKKKKSSKKSKHDNDDDNDDGGGGNNNDEEQLLHGATSITNKHSLLPLGGGGVVMKKKSFLTNTSSKKESYASSSKPEPFIEALGFSRLAKGTKLLGIVREVQDEFALISLPNLLTGYVLQNELSNNGQPLTKIISVGQVLAVAVIRTVTEHIPSKRNNGNNNNKQSTAMKRRIQVSLSPSMINLRHEHPTPKFPIRGRVQAIEDNGLLIDLGHGRKGFLAFNEMDENSYKVKESDDNDDNNDNEGGDNNNTIDNDSDDDDGDGSDDGDRFVLRKGSICDFLVKKDIKHSTDIVPLSLPSPDVMAKHMVPSDAVPSIQSILPGWLVKVKVESAARNGLCVAFLGNVFRGAIELAHLGGFWIPTTRQADGSTEWKSLFRDDVGSSSPIRSFKARILAVDAATKTIRLTVLPHLMDLRSQPTNLLPPPGTVVHNATVIKLDPGVGALLALPSSSTTQVDKMDVDKDSGDDDDDDDDVDSDDGEDGEDDAGNVSKSLLHQPLSDKKSYKEATKIRAVYVHISKATDEKEDGRTTEATFAKEFAPSTKHSLRILSTSNLVEGVASGATAESIIKAHVLTYTDLTPGKIFNKVPVLAHLEGGAVLVEFGMEVRGLITIHHLFDQAGTSEYRAKMLKAKYSIGSKVDVRVLSTDATTKRCFVTAKKSLLQATNIVTSYTGCKVGQIATGFISKVDNRGLFVTFFNKVYGKVPARSLALELGIDDHRQNYQVGDVVQCRIANKKKVRRLHRQQRREDEESDDDDGDPDSFFWEMTLSLRVTAEDENNKSEVETGEQALQGKVHLRAGVVLPLKAMKVVKLVPGKGKPNGKFVPGYAIVSVRSKYLVDRAESATMLPYVECKLPYDNLLDSYNPSDVASSASLDALAEKMLPVGKTLKQKGVLLTDPKKSNFEYSAGTGRLTVVSIRPRLVDVAETQLEADENKKQTDQFVLPSPGSNLYEGAHVLGYVAHIHDRHGAFIRFLDGLTGLVPKNKNAFELELFSTVVARIESVDHMCSPPKILLSVNTDERSAETVKLKKYSIDEDTPFQEGEVVEEAEIESLDFFNANMNILDKKWKDLEIKARIHCTLASSKSFDREKVAAEGESKKRGTITKFHPFHHWAVGKKLNNLKIVAASLNNGIYYVELTDRDDAIFLTRKDQVPVGSQLSGVVRHVAPFNCGVYVALGPKLTGFIPGVECSTGIDELNNLPSHFPLGSRIDCTVIDKLHWLRLKAQATNCYSSKIATDIHPEVVFLSVLSRTSSLPLPTTKPSNGDLVIGQIQRSLRPIHGPALMLELRGGYLGRCCITELEEPDEWSNMPLGSSVDAWKESAIVSGESDIEAEEELGPVLKQPIVASQEEPFSNGKYVQCRVLSGIPSRPAVEVSLRPSRIEGDLDDDKLPEKGEMCHAYVVDTNKGGCFVRIARNIEGRALLKELSDEFLPNPAASFPRGRIVVGKVKEIKQQVKKNKKNKVVELDMRESTVLESQQLQFSDVHINSKHKATVTRVESYGVFVRIEKSKVSGLVHKSECSDKFVKDLSQLYDPGDLVKVLVIKKDEEQHRIAFSMKASHFVDDEDTDDGDDDDDSMSETKSHESDDEDEEGDNDNDENMPDVVPGADGEENDELESDDPGFGSKLALSKKKGSKKPESDSTDDDSSRSSSSESDSSSSGDGSDAEEHRPSKDSATKKGAEDSVVMDTDVGFSWSASAADISNKSSADIDSDSDDYDMDDVEAMPASSSHKSRKKQAQKRREEQEISRREIALADGTADENPETAADFERLLSGSPNSSEIWIRYMAFHLSLADIPSARAVAERAFSRIEFREEREKLNVWSALLTLELKYGNPSSLQATIDRACQQNNPKKVYLRVCEMVEKEVNPSLPETVIRADEMFNKLCKKFKSKKKAWLAHLQYLLKSGRHKDAHDLLRRSLKSLPGYKHIETMSKFAQLEFEFGSADRARTLFDGIIIKHPKRLDLVFVYADKELKHGSAEMARGIFEQLANPRGNAPKSRLSDKQMKSLFKKWYRMEEVHGTPETQEHVKVAAKAYVEKST